MSEFLFEFLLCHPERSRTAAFRQFGAVEGPCVLPAILDQSFVNPFFMNLLRIFWHDGDVFGPKLGGANELPLQP